MFKRNKSDSKINQQYYVTCNNITIAKVTVKGELRYEVFKDKVYLGYAGTFEDAKRKVE